MDLGPVGGNAAQPSEHVTDCRRALPGGLAQAARHLMAQEPHSHSHDDGNRQDDKGVLEDPRAASAELRVAKPTHQKIPSLC